MKRKDDGKDDDVIGDKSRQRAVDGLPLWDHPQTDGIIEPLFDGETADAELDGPRLNKQLQAVRALMSDEQWRTLADISAAIGAPEASVSARLRDLRKSRFGCLTVNSRRQRQSAGTWAYQVILNEQHPERDSLRQAWERAQEP